MDADPVFEEAYHGAVGGIEEESFALEKEESAGSTSGASIEDEDHVRKV